jgi:hypothetical protein
MAITPLNPEKSPIGDLVATRLQILLPELIDLFRYSSQRLFPACFHLIDCPTTIGAKHVRETVNLNLTHSVSHRALYDCGSTFNLFLLGKPGGLAQLLDQGLLFGLGGGLAALFLFALLGFRERGLFLDFLCIGSSWSMFGSMLDLWNGAPVVE